MKRLSLTSALAAGFLALAGSVTSEAAELRISITELAKIATAGLADAKLRLHTLPGGFLSFAAGSWLTIGNTKIPIPVPDKPFDVAGGRYVYYANEVNSSGLAITPIQSALRVKVTFEDAAPELVGRCTSGFCVPESSLPQIEWRDPAVTIDVAPVLAGDSLSLEVKSVDVAGKFETRCADSSGILARSVCRVVLSRAQETVTKITADMNGMLKNLMNAPEQQKKLADAIKGKLAFGTAGQVKVSAVKVEGDVVTLTFCLAC